jgi:hypothetical protein
MRRKGCLEDISNKMQSVKRIKLNGEEAEGEGERGGGGRGGRRQLE